MVGKHPVSERWVLRTPAGRVFVEPETVPFQGRHRERAKGHPLPPHLAWHSVRKESQDPFCLESPQEEPHEGEIMPTEHPREEENQGADVVSTLRGKS